MHDNKHPVNIRACYLQVLKSSHLSEWGKQCPTLDDNLRYFKSSRCEQGLNLRGKIPLDFESNALTTRPSQHPKPEMKIRENGSFSFIKIISNASEQFDTERQKHMLNKKTTI